MRRTSSIGIGTAIMACFLACWGCGGSLQDTPDTSKGPSIGAGKLKTAEEMKNRAAAAAAAGKGMAKQAGRR
jgi:hypothetical protein